MGGRGGGIYTRAGLRREVKRGGQQRRRRWEEEEGREKTVVKKEDEEGAVGRKSYVSNTTGLNEEGLSKEDEPQ